MDLERIRELVARIEGIQIQLDDVLDRLEQEALVQKAIIEEYADARKERPEGRYPTLDLKKKVAKGIGFRREEETK